MPTLSDLILGHETERVEFKETWRDDTALPTLAAFANTRGGTLLIGVNDKQQLIGWVGDHKKLAALADKIVNNLGTRPSSIRVEEQDGFAILVIDIDSSPTPIAYRGHYYRRIGNTTQEVAQDDLLSFLMKRSRVTWDDLPGPSRIDDLDKEAINDFIQKAKGPRLPHISANEETTAILEKLKLLADGQPKHAATLLFGKSASAPFPMPQVRMGRFKDAETILDDKFIGGPLLQQLDQVLQLFRQYLQVRFEIPNHADGRAGVESIQRREVWEYPLDALREAVVNALIHRDYTSQANVQIQVYDDKVTIRNPGSLPEGLTVADLKREGHSSVPRNPLLAQIFYYAGLVEHWGTGTTRILSACRKQRLPDPEFAVTEKSFSIIFLKHLTDENLLARGLNARQIMAIRYLQDHDSITNKQYRELTRVSNESARRDLNELVDKGMLHVEGKGRSTYYVRSSIGDVGD